jgi:glutathione peroxidase
MAKFTRRLVLGGMAIGAGMAAAPAGRTAWDFSFSAIDGGTLALADFRGKVLLVTNTASFCGYTYQDEGLEKLHRDLAGRGFAVIGVPSQDFNQESDSNAKVKTFCEATFGVEFPMAGISHVRAADAAPFYAWVRGARNWQPEWNFNKVLIGRDGLIKGTFGSETEPESPALRAAIEAELARPVS